MAVPAVEVSPCLNIVEEETATSEADDRLLEDQYLSEPQEVYEAPVLPVIELPQMPRQRSLPTLDSALSRLPEGLKETLKEQLRGSFREVRLYERG
ncbi:MAG: hypothetical protein JW739_06655 [Opitutales bacterium]|nr:hypothetical protein [Opitutales bacterium]